MLLRYKEKKKEEGRGYIEAAVPTEVTVQYVFPRKPSSLRQSSASAAHLLSPSHTPPPLVYSRLTVLKKGPVKDVGGHKKPFCPLGLSVFSFFEFPLCPTLLTFYNPQAEESAPADSPAPEAPQAAAAAAAVATPTPAPTRGTQKNRGGPAARGGKYYQRGGGAPRPPRENGADDSAAGGTERPKRTCEWFIPFASSCRSFFIDALGI